MSKEFSYCSGLSFASHSKAGGEEQLRTILGRARPSRSPSERELLLGAAKDAGRERFLRVGSGESISKARLTVGWIQNKLDSFRDLARDCAGDKAGAGWGAMMG